MEDSKSLNISVYDIRFTLHNPVSMSKSVAVSQDPLNSLAKVWDDAELVGEATKKLMPEFIDKIMSDITIVVYKHKLGSDEHIKIGEYRPWETLQASLIDHEKFFGKPAEAVPVDRALRA